MAQSIEPKNPEPKTSAQTWAQLLTPYFGALCTLIGTYIVYDKTHPSSPSTNGNDTKKEVVALPTPKPVPIPLPKPPEPIPLPKPPDPVVGIEKTFRFRSQVVCNGFGIPKVSVKLLEASTHPIETITRADGSFYIDIPNNKEKFTLIFESEGYKSAQLPCFKNIKVENINLIASRDDR